MQENLTKLLRDPFYLEFPYLITEIITPEQIKARNDLKRYQALKLKQIIEKRK